MRILGLEVQFVTIGKFAIWKKELENLQSGKKILLFKCKKKKKKNTPPTHGSLTPPSIGKNYASTFACQGGGSFFFYKLGRR